LTTVHSLTPASFLNSVNSLFNGNAIEKEAFIGNS